MKVRGQREMGDMETQGFLYNWKTTAGAYGKGDLQMTKIC